MTPPWPLIEHAAREGRRVLLTPDQCAALVAWHNAVVGDKNQVVRENHALWEKFRGRQEEGDPSQAEAQG